MATLTATEITEAGDNAVSYASADAGGDVVNNINGDVVLHCKNGSGAPITLTVTAQNTDASNPQYGELTKSDATVSVLAGDEAFIGPFRQSAFNNSSGQIAISYSSATTVTIAALKFKFPGQ